MNTEATPPNRFWNEASDERFASVYRVLDEAIAAGGLPGCAFGALRRNESGSELLFQGARGRFTYDPHSRAVTPETVYDVASLTKVVATTAMAMLLYQRGLLDLNVPLGELLPEYLEGRAPDDPARQVRVHHLLAHSSGLPGYVPFFRTASTPRELLQACLKLPLETMPGERAEYSDPGFILLGKALEALAGEALDRWTQREIFTPLGMLSTCFCPPPEGRAAIPPTEDEAARTDGQQQGIVQGCVQDENARVLGGVAGHAGVFSNVPDLLRLARQMLPLQENGISPRLFEPATIAAFAQRQAPAGSSRALGWDTPSENSSSGRYFSLRTIGHLGFSGCSLWIDLEAAVAVVLLSNRTWPDRKNWAIRQLRPAFHNALREAF
jgi:CubicO group peptidase (beta-lactamase class C family)